MAAGRVASETQVCRLQKAPGLGVTELDFSSSSSFCNSRGTDDHGRETQCFRASPHCCLPEPVDCPGDRVFLLRVPNVARRKETWRDLPAPLPKVATHQRCTPSARPCHVQAELGGYFCMLIGGVGRRRKRKRRNVLCGGSEKRRTSWE